MIYHNEERDTAVLYTCGVCNLNCRYCTIDKNPVLKDIDKELEESFKGDYYFNRIKEYFPRKDQLKHIETWGGEPFLHMDRIYPLLHKLIKYYPYFNELFSSTNFSYDDWTNQFMGLANQFAQYPYRQFVIHLQLSVDGPTDMNDNNRGKGVTARCIANFEKLLNIIAEGNFPDNVMIDSYIKGTWDLDCIHKLNNKEKIIEFFKFYEDNYIDKVMKLNNDRIMIGLSIPNTAVPAPTTKQDGVIFAELVKKCREIEQENQTEHYFKYYRNITPFGKEFEEDSSQFAYRGLCAMCGSGHHMVGFLPHNRVSVCHEGFTLLAEQYKEFAAQRSDKNLTVKLNNFFDLYPTPMCLTDDQYIIHERKMSYIDYNSSAQVSSATTLIIALALAGLIDKKYLNETQAMRGARFVLTHASFCIKNNYSMNGSFCNEPADLYILLLNGAMEYILGGNNGDCDFN